MPKKTQCAAIPAAGIVNEETREPAEDPVAKVLRFGVTFERWRTPLGVDSYLHYVAAADGAVLELQSSEGMAPEALVGGRGDGA